MFQWMNCRYRGEISPRFGSISRGFARKHALELNESLESLEATLRYIFEGLIFEAKSPAYPVRGGHFMTKLPWSGDRNSDVVTIATKKAPRETIKQYGLKEVFVRSDSSRGRRIKCGFLPSCCSRPLCSPFMYVTCSRMRPGGPSTCS